MAGLCLSVVVQEELASGTGGQYVVRSFKVPGGGILCSLRRRLHGTLSTAPSRGSVCRLPRQQCGVFPQAPSAISHVRATTFITAGASASRALNWRSVPLSA